MLKGIPRKRIKKIKARIWLIKDCIILGDSALPNPLTEVGQGNINYTCHYASG